MGDSGKEALEANYKPFLHLISKESDWLVRGEEEEEEKFFRETELRLGPPGGDWSLNSTHESFQLSGVAKTCNFSSGAKRGFEGEKEEEEKQKFCSVQKGGGTLFSDPFSPSCSSVFQKQKTPFLQFKQSVQSSQVLLKEAQPTNTQKLELQNHQRSPCSSSPATVVAVAGGSKSILNNSDQRAAASPVVGWPPIRSFRKNLASSSKPAAAAAAAAAPPPPQSQNGVSKICENSEKRKGLFVKINMDGVPIGRKVDLQSYNSYQKLSLAVDELFRGLLAAQKCGPAIGNHNGPEEQPITGLLDGNGEYTLVYEDNVGDRLLAGDVPWEMFVSTVKRLRVLKSSEISSLFNSSKKQLPVATLDS